MKRWKIGSGIYEDAHGITARVRLGSRSTEELTAEERYPLGTDVDEIKDWQARARVTLRGVRKQRGTVVTRGGTWSDDILLYLKTAKLTDATKKVRQQQLGWWAQQPGDDGRPIGQRRRYTLSGPELARVAQHLKSPNPFTRNLYRTAVVHFWRTLDGKGAPNPALDIPRDAEPDALPRGLDYTVVRLILQCVPSKFGRPSQKGEVRLRVFAYAPVTPAQMKLIEKDDLDLEGVLDPEGRPSILVHGRRKGKGAPPRRKPLLPDAVAALRDLAALGLFHDPTRPRKQSPSYFSTSSLRHVFVRARNRAEAILRKGNPTVDLSHVRMYDLRHSFGSLMYRVTGNEGTVGKLMDHRHQRTTARYTLAEVPPHLQAASDAAAAYLANLSAEGPAAKPKRTKCVKVRPATGDFHALLSRTGVKTTENGRKTLKSFTRKNRREDGETTRNTAEKLH